ncbi:MAG TPA: RNA polymerase sigma factor [Terriglobia bacterium]|nr:RNA polymerase sigma factor [Terriglobia bacterium]
MQQSDEQLMLDFQGGSAPAFEELFTRYRQSVYGFFRRRLAHAARAEELAQEVFVIVLRGVERYEQRSTFRAYLFGIAVRQLWSERRRELRDNRKMSESASTGSSSASPSGDPATGIWIRGALERLDPAHREVLMLREYEELSYDDIADALGVPVNTVRSRLFRARAELKTLLDERAMERSSR